MTTARARAYAARREVSDWVMRKMSPVLTPPWRIVGLVSILGGLAVFVSWHPSTWVGLDLARIAAAGAEWHAGRDPYAVGGFLYAPPMAVVGALLTPTFWGAWAAAELALAMALAMALAPRSVPVLLVAVTWPGVLSDVALGNVTVVLVVAAMLAVRHDRLAAGVPLGVALAAAPKPMFLMLLLWLLVHRRRTFWGVAVGGASLTLAVAFLLGPSLYVEFVGVILRGVDPRFVGNSGLSYLWPLGGAFAWLASAVAAVLLIRRPEAGLMAAAVAGTFAGTYAAIYSTTLPLAVLPLYQQRFAKSSRYVALCGLLSWWSLWVAGALALAVIAWSAIRDPLNGKKDAVLVQTAGGP
jgi:hypothetical protein